MRFEIGNIRPDKERLIAALKGGIPDKVPLFDNYIDDKIVENILGYNAGNTVAAIGDPYRGDARAIVEGDVCIPMDPKDFVKLCNIIGQDTIMIEHAFVPYRVLNDKGQLEIVNDGRIKNRKDWEKVIIPGDKDIKDRIYYLKAYLDAAGGTDIAVTLQTGNFFLTHYHNLNGGEFFSLIYDDPGLVEEMLTASSDYFAKYVREAMKLGFDVFMSGDDVAYKGGLMINPEHFKKLYKPHAEKIYEPVLNAGIPIIFDCDGNPTEIIDMIIELGCSALFPIDANGLDYREVKKKYGKKLSLYGAIDTDPLLRYSSDEVEKYVKEVVEVMKADGGYIAGTVSSVNEIPFDNYMTMINVIHKHGKY
jgi:uroporphyrinogen decarboxylase